MNFSLSGEEQEKASLGQMEVLTEFFRPPECQVSSLEEQGALSITQSESF